jgi:hypothetical protein
VSRNCERRYRMCVWTLRNAALERLAGATGSRCARKLYLRRPLVSCLAEQFLEPTTPCLDTSDGLYCRFDCPRSLRYFSISVLGPAESSGT